MEMIQPLWAHNADRKPVVVSKGRLLLFSYAFPPIQTQMTPAVVKPMAALVRYGYEVDVLCAAPFSKYYSNDECLLPIVKKHFPKITRLQPRDGFLEKLRLRSKILSTRPDIMSILQHEAFGTLMDMDLTQYQVIMTWSPAHSINPVMVRLKKNRRETRWLAQFSDPWAGNPLDRRILAKIWNEWQEPYTVAAADFIVHSSSYSRNLMVNKHGANLVAKSAVIPHCYDSELFPQRAKAINERVTLRYIGSLCGRRSPEPLFDAVNKLLGRRPELRDRLHIELVGSVPREMLESLSAVALPAGMVTHLPHVTYMESLEKMYDADILVLIEANVRQNLFLPSKLSDYIGAGTPIVGIAPPGESEDALRGLGCWHARPSDIAGISDAIERAVNHVMNTPEAAWCNEAYKQSINCGHVAKQFAHILDKIK